MNKLIAAVTWFLIISEVLHAQLDTFDLSTYRLPVIKRSQLDLTIDLTGSNRTYKDRNEGMPSASRSNLYLHNNTNLAFSSYLNSEKIQSSQYYSFGFSPEINRWVINDTSTEKSSHLSSDIYFSSSNRFYFSKQLFFESDIIFSGNLNNYKSNYESTGIRNASNLTNIDIQIPLMIGKGRIEQVQDARLAVYILEDLLKSGRISRIPNEEEILDFAGLISKIKSERFFDSRLKRMYEIEKVDSFLQARALPLPPDARYFTIVYDNWDYASGPVRESGNRISAGIIPLFKYQKSYDMNENPPYDEVEYEDRDISCGMKVHIIYTSAKPINLHWQRDWSISTSYGYQKEWQKDLINESNSDLNKHALEGTFAYGLGFFPNSRTDFKAIIGVDIIQSMLKDTYNGLDNRIRNLEVAPRFLMAMHYYISPQTRLDVSYSSHYNYTNGNTKNSYQEEFLYDKHNSFQQNFNVGFVYSFF